MSDSLQPHGLYSPWNSPGQNTGVGRHSLLHGILPTQGLNLGLPHCRWILYQLSHQGSPRILEWVAYPFLQQIFPTQEWNQGLLHCRWILYQLSYQGSPPFLINSHKYNQSPMTGMSISYLFTPKSPSNLARLHLRWKPRSPFSPNHPISSLPPFRVLPFLQDGEEEPLHPL